MEHDSVAATAANPFSLATEEELIALDLALHAGKTDGSLERARMARAINDDIRHGLGLPQ